MRLLGAFNVITFMTLFFLIGFGLLGFGLWEARRSRAAAYWPSMRGEIDSCELATTQGREGPSFVVKVIYHYRVGDGEYTHDRLAFGYKGSNVLATHQQIVDRLKSARSVRVLYDPNDPQNAVLSFGVHQTLQLLLAFSALWLVFTAGFSFMFWLASQNDSGLLKNMVTQ
jgi:hypothetical protein